MLQDVGIAFIVACDCITGISVDENANHSALKGFSTLPLFLPYDLVQVFPADFLLKAQHKAFFLETFYGTQQINAIADKHKFLVHVYRNEHVHRAALDECDVTIFFKQQENC